MRVFCVNGIRGSGKTTFEEFCFALNPIYVRSYSSIDEIKRIAALCGWEGGKTDKDRQFLGDLKQLCIKYYDLPFKDVCNYIERTIRWAGNRDLEADRLVFFIDVREPKEIQKLKDKYNAETILLSRGTTAETLGPGDSTESIMNYKYDYIIENAGDLEQLKWEARQFMESNHLVLGRRI